MEIKVQTEEESAGMFAEVGKLLRELAEKATGSQIAVAKATGSAIKRSLMGFDKLNRLTAQSGKGKAKNSIADFIAALKDDKALSKLSQPLAGIAKIFRSMGVELDTTQKRLERIKGSMNDMALPISRLIASTGDFCNALMGVPFSAERAGAALSSLDIRTIDTAGLLEKLPRSASQAADGLERCFINTADLFKKQVSDPLSRLYDSMFSGLRPAAREAMDGTAQVFSGGAAAIADSFRKSWDQVLGLFTKTDDSVTSLASGVVSTMKSVINRLISGINSAIVEPFSGINNAFSKLKSFTVNGLQPFKNLNFSVSMPKIPLLASGAVLPANKPFLAMVGDQKHGTNVEAPLATIQQAVAGVMEQVVEAEMAGHNQTVLVLRQILEAVLGIRLDEDTLGRAAQRYSARQAMMTGGF